VVLNGKQYELELLKPLLVDIKENHSGLSIDNAPGIKLNMIPSAFAQPLNSRLVAV